MILKKLFSLTLYITYLFFSSANSGSLNVVDDAGYSVKLNQQAQRVISLSPHLTELLYLVGANKQIVAAVEYSNYPEAAKSLPRVGSGYQLDIEAIVGLKPDLIFGWQSGNNRGQLEQLKKLGFNLYLSEPKKLEDIADNLRDLGVLLGTESIAEQQADDFIKGFNDLKRNHRYDKKLKVFYQVWQQPLFTVNGDHIISTIIEICGGENIFKEMSMISPQVDIETVISRNPDVIFAGTGEARQDWLLNWNKWTSIAAVRNKQVYGINADLIVRHTPRILQGAELMCEALQKARENKQKN